jgi:DNA-binding transcriptional MerR regulator
MDNMTIDQMIAAGLPWEQIKARINELQKEQVKKEKAAAALLKAEEAEKRAKTQEKEIARQRLVAEFVNYLTLEGVIDSEEEAKFMVGVVNESIVDLVQSIRAEMAQREFLARMISYLNKK